jgi:hypothetical protein
MRKKPDGNIHPAFFIVNGDKRKVGTKWGQIPKNKKGDFLAVA